jgi:hypothetical protein
MCVNVLKNSKYLKIKGQKYEITSVDNSCSFSSHVHNTDHDLCVVRSSTDAFVYREIVLFLTVIWSQAYHARNVSVPRPYRECITTVSRVYLDHTASLSRPNLQCTATILRVYHTVSVSRLSRVYRDHTVSELRLHSECNATISRVYRNNNECMATIPWVYRARTVNYL